MSKNISVCISDTPCFRQLHLPVIGDKDGRVEVTICRGSGDFINAVHCPARDEGIWFSDRDPLTGKQYDTIVDEKDEAE